MVFFIFHKAWESVLEYNYQDTYARALPSAAAFSCVFSALRERRVKLRLLLYGSPLQMVEGSSQQSLARHRAWLSTTCWFRTSARESGLDIFLVLKSCHICFCFKRRKLPKPRCSLAAVRAVGWILTFCSQRHHQVPRISSLLNGAWGKPDCGVLEPSGVGEL